MSEEHPNLPDSLLEAVGKESGPASSEVSTEQVATRPEPNLKRERRELALRQLALASDELKSLRAHFQREHKVLNDELFARTRIETRELDLATEKLRAVMVDLERRQKVPWAQYGLVLVCGVLLGVLLSVLLGSIFL